MQKVDGDSYMKGYTALTLNGEFRMLYHRGKSAVHGAIVVYARPNRQKKLRLGITTGKKLGGAVQRNRCRRIIREAFRLLVPQITGGWDIVCVARVRALNMKSQQIQAIMEKLLCELGVIPQ